MTIIVVGAAVYAGLAILILALLRAAARRDRGRARLAAPAGATRGPGSWSGALAERTDRRTEVADRGPTSIVGPSAGDRRRDARRTGPGSGAGQGPGFPRSSEQQAPGEEGSRGGSATPCAHPPGARAFRSTSSQRHHCVGLRCAHLPVLTVHATAAGPARGSPSVLLDREAERQEVIAFLDAVPRARRASWSNGPPGSGRTALWRHAGGEARSRSYRVLASQPTEAERDLPFVVLTDLLEPVLEQILPALTDPERGPSPWSCCWPRRGTALPTSRRVDGRAARAPGAGPKRSPGRGRGRRGSGWIARPARVLAYVSRRLVEERIGVLTVVRAGGPDLLDPGRPGTASCGA
jgi:hypothetical protein